MTQRTSYKIHILISSSQKLNPICSASRRSLNKKALKPYIRLTPVNIFPNVQVLLGIPLCWAADP
jgi:hypothetical protein